jgi:hypothetical protein
MPLIDLKTDLKSLKYGLDRRGGGSSKEPFITKPIPEGETPGATRDFLLRQGAITSGLEDVSRLTKLFSTTRGLSFIGTSELLAAQNPKYPGTPKNVYLPTSTLAQVPLVAEGGHLNHLGVNPFNNDGRYFEVYKRDFSERGTNRLSILQQQKIGTKYELSPDVRVNAVLDQGIALGPRNILNYLGGPNAGRNGLNTTIRRTEYTVGSNGYSGPRIQDSLNRALIQIADAKTYFNQNSPLGSISEVNYGVVSDNKVVTLQTAYNKGTNASSIQKYKANPDFKKYKYNNRDIDGDYKGDKFNKLNTELLNNSKIGEDAPDSQLFKFYVNLINANNPGKDQYLYWQAYLDNFNDQIGADYDSYNYVGRGYPLYKYKGFTRSIGLDFTIVAPTPTQILPIYQKLNSLIQNMAPNYSGAGYLRGNFVKLTVGDYLNNVPGIITGFSLSPIFEAGFELSSGRQLPKAIKVSGFNFTPITDNDSGLVTSDSNFILDKVSSLRGAADVDPTLGDSGTELDFSDIENIA